jgi:hypothetical protein
MRFRSWVQALTTFVLASVVLGMTGFAALAHEQNDVGSYRLEVGFLVEPAIEGQMNGIDLRVTNSATSQPVQNLENTLQVEITCIPAEISRTFTIQRIDPDGDPGHYHNSFILTAPGPYSFRFFGTIEGFQLNATFTSGPNTFSDVLPASDVQFPQQYPSARELTGVVKAAQSMAQQAADSADKAANLGYIGIAIGALGIIIGVASLVIARRKR